MAAELHDVAPGLWLWRLEHPDWSPGLDWEPLVASTCVESGGEVALLDPGAPPDEADEVWERLDARPPTLVVVLKPDHVRDVDIFVRRYGARAFGPWLFWRDDIPETDLDPIEPGSELPGGLVAPRCGRCSSSRSSTSSCPTASPCTTAPPTSGRSSCRLGAADRLRLSRSSAAHPSRKVVPPASGRTGSRPAPACPHGGDPVRDPRARRRAPSSRSGGSRLRRGGTR